MHIRKLDKRYNGNEFWTHRAEPKVTYGLARAKLLVNFYDQREFLNRTFGMGAFIEEVWALKKAEREIPKWGFDADCNVFLREEALVTFELAKGRWE